MIWHFHVKACKVDIILLLYIYIYIYIYIKSERYREKRERKERQTDRQTDFALGQFIPNRPPNMWLLVLSCMDECMYMRTI